MPPGDAQYERPLHVFFDVDGTLITWDNKIRPHVHEVFQQITDDGHTIHIWSGVGIRQEVVDRHELHPWVEGLYRKPLYDYRARVLEFAPVRPDFVVDDYPEIVWDLSGGRYGGVQVRPPIWPMDNDGEMWRAYEALAKHVRRLRQWDADGAAPA